MAETLRKIANDFRTAKPDFSAPLKAMEPALRRDLDAGLASIPGPGSLAERLDPGGHARMVARLRAASFASTKTAAYIALPRGSREKTMSFLYGSQRKIKSPAQVAALRHRAVEAGVFDRRVLFLPPTSPPFGLGTEINQPARDPGELSEATLDQATDSILDSALTQLGWR